MSGSSRSGLALLALAVSAFAIGTTEFVIAGLLPGLAADLRVSIPTAGLVVSCYALGVVVGAPLVTAIVAGWPRRRVLLGLLVLFVAGNTTSALAPTFGVLLCGRVLAALCHGAFFGVGSIVAASLVSPDRRARALAAMFTGLTVSTVAGVPLGTLVGQVWGWRAVFWGITALGLLGMAGIAALVPPLPAASGARGEVAAFRASRVWLALAMTALGFGAVYAPFTFVAPLLTDVTGFASGAVPWLLAVFGAGLVLGNVVGARAADRRLMATIIVLLAALTVVLAVLPWMARERPTAVVALFALGFVAFATVPAFTSRVIACAGSDNALASSAAVAAFNLGNATGAYLAGRAIATGHGYASTGLVGAAMAAAGLVVALLSAAADRRGARPDHQLDRHPADHAPTGL